MTDDVQLHKLEGKQYALAKDVQPYFAELAKARKRIEALERLEQQMPAILEYLESQADVVDGDNGIPHPNKAMTLLVWLRHEVEKKDEQ